MSKEDFYFIDRSDGLKHFECVFCGDRPIAGHRSEWEYWPTECLHPVLRELDGQGRMCSNCYNWDFDVWKRDPPRKRDPLKHKSGRLLGVKGWLDEGNDKMEKFL